MHFCSLLHWPTPILVIAGRNAGLLLENSTEIGLAGKSDFQSDLGNGHSAHFQQPLCLLDAVAAQVSHRSNAHLPVEAAREILFIHR